MFRGPPRGAAPTFLLKPKSLKKTVVTERNLVYNDKQRVTPNDRNLSGAIPNDKEWNQL